MSVRPEGDVITFLQDHTEIAGIPTIYVEIFLIARMLASLAWCMMRDNNHATRGNCIGKQITQSN